MNVSNKKFKLKIFIPLFILVAILVSFFCYTGTYYHASEDTNTYLEDSTTVTVSDNGNYYAFVPSYNFSHTGIIFYPGAKVEAKAYAPLCNKLAKSGIYVALVKMPFNIAFFNGNAADDIYGKNETITNYYLMGHSLGGVVASSYLIKHLDNYKGIIFLASYTTKDLSKTSLNVSSIYGSNDTVLNKDSYNESKKNLPSNYKEYVIEGGNHSGFAYYGPQDKDGEATISKEEQINITVASILLSIAIGE